MKISHNIHPSFVTTIVLIIISGTFVCSAPTNPQNRVEVRKELVLVQTIWRHGDRTPDRSWASDLLQEEQWSQGYGQLTPEGMRQLVVLGQRLRRRYVDELQFVKPHYDSRSVHIRSTDIHRTIASAIAKMIGFYGPNARPGQDFPEHQDWPAPFVPVAVHTASNNRDHLNPDKECARHQALQELMWQTPEFLRFAEEKAGLYKFLSEHCGQPIGPMDIWWLTDSIRVKRLYNRTLPAWLTTGIEAEMFGIHRVLRRWREGMGVRALDGVDLGSEIRRVRGGLVLWKLIENIQQKLHCHDVVAIDSSGGGDGGASAATRRTTTREDGDDHFCEWMLNRQYSGYSAHEVTLQSLFLTLGFNETNIDRDEPPHYAACVSVELWRETTSGANSHVLNPTLRSNQTSTTNATDQETKYNIRVLYWPDEHEPMRELTGLIKFCSSFECPLEAFLANAQQYRPEPNAHEFCKNAKF